MTCREDSTEKRLFLYLFSNTEVREINGLSLLCAQLWESSEHDDKSVLEKFS